MLHSLQPHGRRDFTAVVKRSIGMRNSNQHPFNNVQGRKCNEVHLMHIFSRFYIMLRQV